MPLTPQDVHSKVFGPTRFRRGYDEAEVDAFLDEVEAELTRLHREIDSLRGQLGQPTDASGDVADTGSMPPITADGSDAEAGTPVATAGPDEAATSAPATPSMTKPAVQERDGNLEQQVARALVLAQRAADEAVRDAEEQAEQLRRSATGEAERIRLEAAEQAERARRELEHTRSQAEDDVEQLRAFEREYRTRLRAYLEHQLRELEESGTQVEGHQPDSLDAGASGGAPDGRPHAVAAAPGQLPSDLLTDELPADDPAAVPSVAARSDVHQVPPSVAVSDYSSPAGVGESATGDELRHERRDLHDGL